ncbi:MAG: hypothetical protein ACK5CL_03395 [Sphingomonadales bacterium]
MKYRLFLTVFYLCSCNNRDGKYLRATENWDGPRCKTFEYRDFEVVELAKCIETDIYLLSYNKSYPKIAQYLDYEAVSVYIKSEENIDIFNNSQFILKTFEEAASKGRIEGIALNDSIMELTIINDQREQSTYSYKLNNSTVNSLKN